MESSIKGLGIPPYIMEREPKTYRYDFVIIGSGPNGLALGAYLSKAGAKVLMLDKSFELGGGLLFAR